MAGSYSEALRSPSFESDRERFFRILLHDDRKSFYVISTDASGEWADTALKADCLSSYQFDIVSNYYITHNGFTGKRRLTVRTRQLNALFFDLDCHGVPVEESGVLVRNALERLNEAVRTGVLPGPSILVNSGRGLHLYYVLNRSIPYRFTGSGDINEQGLSFFSHVQSQLADVIEHVMTGLRGLTVDRAVFDYTRVSRIPDTFNKKAGCFARLLRAEEIYYSLSELNCYKSAASTGNSVAPRRSQGKTAVILRYNRLMMARLGKVAELQAYRGYDCEGTRELMSFVYYNTAVQIYSKEDAWDRLLAFNSQFKSPLSLSELEGIVRSVSEVTNVKGEKGYYILGADTLVRLLAMTEKEMLDTQFFASKRMVDRMEAKRKTKEKRNARNEHIIALYKGGAMTQQQIADEVGCTPRTVYSVLKSAGLTRRGSDSAASAAAGRSLTSLVLAARSALDMRLSWDSFFNKGRVFRTQKSENFWQTCLLRSENGEVAKNLVQNSFVQEFAELPSIFDLKELLSLEGWLRFSKVDVVRLLSRLMPCLVGNTPPLPFWIGGSSLGVYGSG